MNSFCPAKSLSDKCPVNLSNENNIPTKLAAVLQILILSCIRFQTDSISRKYFAKTKGHSF